MKRLAFLFALFALGAAPAQASQTTCKSADLRYPFTKGGPKTFGVFKLTVDGGTCTTAHRVAKAWMSAFEANLRAGSERRPKRVSGFTFTTLKATEAQTFRERGTKGATTIRFNYVVPNG